jgi:hypothetical protein
MLIAHNFPVSLLSDFEIFQSNFVEHKFSFTSTALDCLVTHVGEYIHCKSKVGCIWDLLQQFGCKHIHDIARKYFSSTGPLFHGPMLDLAVRPWNLEILIADAIND